jgi:hypothetical protein
VLKILSVVLGQLRLTEMIRSLTVSEGLSSEGSDEVYACPMLLMKCTWKAHSVADKAAILLCEVCVGTRVANRCRKS